MAKLDGFFQKSSAAGEGAVGLFNKAGGAVVDAGTKGAKAVGGALVGGVGAVAGGAAGVAKGIVKSPVASLKGVIGVAAIAAAAAGVYYAIRGGKKQQSSSEAMTAAALNDLPPPLAMDMPQTMMGMQPQPGEHAARVQASRAGGQQLGM